jgi:hypothetical protein
MSSPTNLTDSLTRLRERNGCSDLLQRQSANKKPSTAANNSDRERRFATDNFMIIAYTLLGLATLCQLVLIVWLDII